MLDMIGYVLGQSHIRCYPVAGSDCWGGTGGTGGRSKIWLYPDRGMNIRRSPRFSRVHHVYSPYAPSMVYLPTFGWFLGQMLVNIPYMEHMGRVLTHTHIYIYIGLNVHVNIWGIIWMFPKIGVPMGTLKSSILYRIVHYKPSILGYPHLRNHPYPHIFQYIVAISCNIARSADMAAMSHKLPVTCQ